MAERRRTFQINRSVQAVPFSLRSSGPFTRVGESIAYRFGEHGAEVGAKSVWQYLRKANEFLRETRTARSVQKIIRDDNTTKYIRNGRYIIVNGENQILSFGNVR